MLEARLEEVPVVVLTGYGSIATAMEAVRLGARDYLTKPVDPDDLFEVLGRWIVAPGASRARDASAAAPAACSLSCMTPGPASAGPASISARPTSPKRAA